MKIALIQQNYHIGNFELNTQKIISGMRQAKEAGADLAVFSELCVCGYPPRDFLEFDDFINRCYQAIDEIREHTADIAVIVGSPARNPVPEGKDLFNAAWFLHEKEVKALVHKTCLPTYDVFDEYRYFEPGYEWRLIPFKGKRIALTVCEDIWNLGDNPLYRVCPMDQLMPQQPDLMINISASPFDYDHERDRRAVVRENVLKYKLPMYYCNAIGSQTEIVFDGSSVIYDAAGNLTHRLKAFEEDFCIADTEKQYKALEDDAARTVLPGYVDLSTITDEPSTDPAFAEASAGEAVNRPLSSAIPPPQSYGGQSRPLSSVIYHLSSINQIISYLTRSSNIEEIHDALILGIRDYFRKMNFSKAILGSSGGIDSAVTLALACEALGEKQVRAVAMPSGYSTSHSVSDAKELSANLGNPFDILPIQPVYESLLATLKPVFGDLPFNIAEENLQSRTRGNLLMGLANKFGYILLNTSNKSELATGYGTLYGDMAGGLSVIGDVYKTQVYALARFINRNGEIIPNHILTKAPSAELRPDQKDSDSLPEYDLLDRILYLYIERRKGPREIVAMGMEEGLVARVLRMVNSNEYKRNQFCPIIRVSCKAFGVGRRVPIVGKYLG
ncbi:MAG TPA: NAD+ synthase [Puia sp.]|nr:NAD+ synthase [Puia sp.]